MRISSFFSAAYFWTMRSTGGRDSYPASTREAARATSGSLSRRIGIRASTALGDSFPSRVSTASTRPAGSLIFLKYFLKSFTASSSTGAATLTDEGSRTAGTSAEGAGSERRSRR